MSEDEAKRDPSLHTYQTRFKKIRGLYMDQIKLTPGKLLNVYGNLNEAGYATSLVKEYHRHDIKAKKLRIKRMGLLLYR